MLILNTSVLPTNCVIHKVYGIVDASIIVPNEYINKLSKGSAHSFEIKEKRKELYNELIYQCDNIFLRREAEKPNVILNAQLCESSIETIEGTRWIITILGTPAVITYSDGSYL